MAAVRLKHIGSGTDILDAGKGHAFHAASSGRLEVIALAVNILPARQHHTLHAALSGTFQEIGLAVDILPARQHLPFGSQITIFGKVIRFCAHILNSGQQRAFDFISAGLLEIKGLSIDIFPSKSHRALLAQCAFFFKIKSVFGHLLPSGLQIAFFIKVICLTVDILPAGYFLQRSGSIRLKIADSLFCLLPARLCGFRYFRCGSRCRRRSRTGLCRRFRAHFRRHRYLRNLLACLLFCLFRSSFFRTFRRFRCRRKRVVLHRRICHVLLYDVFVFLWSL